MTNNNIVWQLPIVESNKTDHDWVINRRKYHACIMVKRGIGIDLYELDEDINKKQK
ncbi:hypothetical protein [Bacillus sp. AF23]|uniref:hypothetical protein n=1 Tax=Bacillus sp. AF23 TaxID=2821151 RepID=UPI001E468CD0|nr:hypothetical protein [Bacillus sp. AF23]MCC8351574.1 hypothetical protein [Bacillus sp. AF23]